MNNRTVNIEFLNVLVENLDKQKNEINNYKRKIYQILEENEKIFNDKLNNFQELNNDINNSFIKYEERINSLINIIYYNIIPNYKNMNDCIVDIFMKDLKNEIENIFNNEKF